VCNAYDQILSSRFLFGPYLGSMRKPEQVLLPLVSDEETDLSSAQDHTVSAGPISSVITLHLLRELGPSKP
jgi:hypothetical protein